MKKTFLVPLFIAASALAFQGCSNLTKNLPFAPGSQPTENLYAFQAATSIGLASSLGNQQEGVMRALELKDESVIEEITNYLPTVDQALQGMDDLTSAKEEKSDREGYEFKLTISYKDAGLANESFTMYYNETLLGDDENNDQGMEESSQEETTTELDYTTDTELLPNNAKDEDEKDDDDEEEEQDSEQETQIDGIIVTKDKEYVMHGEKELDPTDNEYEVSFEYHVDDQTLVKVEQEIENGEQEFEYTIEKNGEEIYEYSIEIENDSVELEVKEAGVMENEYEFKLVTKDGKTLFKVTHENDKDKTSYLFEKVVSEDGNISYTIVE